LDAERIRGKPQKLRLGKPLGGEIYVASEPSATPVKTYAPQRPQNWAVVVNRLGLMTMQMLFSNFSTGIPEVAEIRISRGCGTSQQAHSGGNDHGAG
jgi:hypothetical protein